ncbi:MAG: acyl carrier protein [Cyanobacteriota bacterium]|nr:acyl carrier protein [Cyanobacteriota bacterium]
METTKAKIRSYLSQFLEDEELSDDRDLFSLGFTSMFSMQLILFLEQEFQIALDAEDLDANALKTVNAIANLIESKKASV